VVNSFGNLDERDGSLTGAKFIGQPSERLAIGDLGGEGFSIPSAKGVLNTHFVDPEAKLNGRHTKDTLARSLDPESSYLF